MNPIEIYSAADFRRWLTKHHKTETKISIIIHKKHTGKTSPTHREQIEEAICFGWIDTTLKRLDHDLYMRNFSKRTTNSRWSDNTLSYAKRLVKEGKMTPEGMKFYKLGLMKPTHDHGIPKNPDMPLELKKALDKEPMVKKQFDKTAPSMKRTLYRWLLRAKQPATRAKRVEQIMAQTRKSAKDFFRSANNT